MVHPGSSIESLLEAAKPWLTQCGNCDGGLAMSCTCPNEDPRNLIAGMYNQLGVYAALIKYVRPLSDLDLRLRLAEVEAMHGDSDGCGGPGSYDELPCGACVDCDMARIAFYFRKEREQADRYLHAGFKWAPYVLNWQEFTDGLPGGKAPYCHLYDKPKESK